MKDKPKTWEQMTFMERLVADIERVRIDCATAKVLSPEAHRALARLLKHTTGYPVDRDTGVVW